uniref:Uncharacterized protein n=1 Tax=Tetranychus urticae TaxID=32264 RepID=T1KPQ3_TETUR
MAEKATETVDPRKKFNISRHDRILWGSKPPTDFFSPKVRTAIPTSSTGPHWIANPGSPSFRLFSHNLSIKLLA